MIEHMLVFSKIQGKDPGGNSTQIDGLIGSNQLESNIAGEFAST
jgi:hypothetical protein